MTRHGRFDWSAAPRTPCIARITTRLSFSAIMANPRKFSEKIALHNQKQAEETAAFEAIMREVVSIFPMWICVVNGRVLDVRRRGDAHRGTLVVVESVPC